MGLLKKAFKVFSPLKLAAGLFKGMMPKAPKMPDPAPAAPANDAAATAERERLAEEERLRRIALGRMSTNPTGGLGDTSAPNLAGKALLGA